MALFVLKEGYRVTTTPKGGSVVHIRTGDALELNALELHVLARSITGGIDASDERVKAIVKKLTNLGLLVKAPPQAPRTVPTFDELTLDVDKALSDAKHAAAPPPAGPLPRFRGGLQVVTHPETNLCDIIDPATMQTLSVHDFELSLARLLDGKRTYAEVFTAAERLGIPVNPESLLQFIKQLTAIGFMAPPGSVETGPRSSFPTRERWDSTVRENFQAGLRLRREGRYAEAISAFELVLIRDPKNPEAKDALVAVRRSLAETQPADGKPAPASAPGPVPASVLGTVPLPGAVRAPDPVPVPGPVPLPGAVRAPGPAPLQASVPLPTPARASAPEPGSLQASVPLPTPARASAPGPGSLPASVPPPTPARASAPVPPPASISAPGSASAPSSAPPMASSASLFEVDVSSFTAGAKTEAAQRLEGPRAEGTPVVPASLRSEGAPRRAVSLPVYIASVAVAAALGWFGATRLGAEAQAPGPGVAARPVAPIKAEPVTSAEPPAVVAVAPHEPPSQPLAVADTQHDAGAALTSLVVDAGLAAPPSPPPESSVDAGPAAPPSPPPQSSVDAGQPLLSDAGEALGRPAGAPGAEQAPDWVIARILKRGRVTMESIVAAADGTPKWSVKKLAEVKRGSVIGSLATTAGRVELVAHKAGLFVPSIADGEAAKTDEVLASIVYTQGFIQATVDLPTAPEGWACEVADKATGQTAPCTVVTASPRAKGLSITATTDPVWFDDCAKPELRLRDAAPVAK